MNHIGRTRTILVGGHESADGADLVRFESTIDNIRVAKPGRRFHDLVSQSLATDDRVVVVPMTFGRNPTMVADAAKTLKWLATSHPGRIALATPFGTIDHLTARLRASANRALASEPDAGVVIVAPRSNPFDEAELHRVAYLVGTHGTASEVFPAIADPDRGVSPTIERLALLGIERSVVVPAGFAATIDEPFGSGALATTRFAGPLMTDTAVARVVQDRVAAALAGLESGHDGIAAGLDADHGHGYAHSHAFDGGGHTHSHADGTTHSHDTHTHSHDGQHAHAHAS